LEPSFPVVVVRGGGAVQRAARPELTQADSATQFTLWTRATVWANVERSEVLPKHNERNGHLRDTLTCHDESELTHRRSVSRRDPVCRAGHAQVLINDW